MLFFGLISKLNIHYSLFAVCQLVVIYKLFVTRYSLLTIHFLLWFMLFNTRRLLTFHLNAIRCLLLTLCYSLFDIRFSLFDAHNYLLNIYYSLLALRFPLFATCNVLFAFHSSRFFRYSLFISRSSLFATFSKYLTLCFILQSFDKFRVYPFQSTCNSSRYCIHLGAPTVFFAKLNNYSTFPPKTTTTVLLPWSV